MPDEARLANDAGRERLEGAYTLCTIGGGIIVLAPTLLPAKGEGVRCHRGFRVSLAFELEAERVLRAGLLLLVLVLLR